MAKRLKTEKGLTFAARYYSFNRAKNLSASEARELSAAGLYIVSVWETNPTELSYFTEQQGISDAKHAKSMGINIGQPAGTPIYFTVDTDVPEPGPVEEYFVGLRAGMAQSNNHPPYTIGVYGGGRVCNRLRAAGLASHTWLAQAHGWAGYDELVNPSIRQMGGTVMFGIDVDLDESDGNAGGWKI